ncbi:MAG: ATPase, partial [Pseudoalteromonas nigrifaciens]
MHKIADLISIFAATFDQSYNTRLVKGEHE